MSSIVHHPPLKRSANTPTIGISCTAVALTEPTAAIVSFQRQLPSLPLHKNDISAASTLLTAVQFSGNYAICATNFAFCAFGNPQPTQPYP